MKLILATAAVAALCAGAPAAFAQDTTSTTTTTGVYGNLGWSHVTTNGADTEGVQGRVGYRFMPFLGVEGELRAGLSTGHTSVDYTAGTPPVTTSTDLGVKQKYGAAGYVVGFLPLMPNRFDLLARVGYGWSRYDLSPSSSSGLPSGSGDEHGIRYGVGAQYLFDGANGVRVDYTRERMSNLDVPAGLDVNNHANVWGVSFVHKF